MEGGFEKKKSFKEACACLKNYSFRDHVDLCMLSKEIFTLDLPSMDQWKTMEKYGRSKYTLND